MLRSVAVIAAAIGLCQPALSSKQRTEYAQTLRAAARDHHFDPLTGVALIWHESGWRAGAVSPDGEDYGLGQLRARYIGACTRDADPVGNPSSGCQAVKASLLSGSYNIRLMAKQITRWRKLCRRKTGRAALFHRWLAGYGGYSKPSQGRWCGQRRLKGRWQDLPKPRAVRDIIRCRRQLIRGRPCKRRPR